MDAISETLSPTRYQPMAVEPSSHREAWLRVVHLSIDVFTMLATSITGASITLCCHVQVVTYSFRRFPQLNVLFGTDRSVKGPIVNPIL